MSRTVVVLETSIGLDLVIRSNPTDDEVRSFVETQKEYVILNAKRHPSEEAYLYGESHDPPEIALVTP